MNATAMLKGMRIVPSTASTSDSVAATPMSELWAVDLPVLAFWILIQLAGLGIALLHVPMAATYPPGERLGLQVLLALQIGSISLLAPAMARSLGTLVVVIAVIWPVLLLAGAMQVQPASSTAQSAAGVTAWVVALTGLCWTTRSSAIQGLIVATAALVAIGGAIAGYLAIEFGSQGDPDAVVPTGLNTTPILLVWRWVDGQPIDGSALPLAAAALIGLCCIAWRTSSLIRHARVLQITQPS